MSRIEIGQVYAKLPDKTHRIRIIDTHDPHPLTGKPYCVTVIDADKNKQVRRVLGNNLHHNPITQYGQPRRSGYLLDEEAP